MKPFFACLIASFFFAVLPAARAQSPNIQFQPGEWQITSTVTPSMGKPVHRQVSICAKNAGQTWQSATPNQKCTAPNLTAIANGYNIKLTCKGGAGPVQWKSSSTIDETFSSSGDEFKANGSTTTTASYSGHGPMQASATIHATGKRTGACR